MVVPKTAATAPDCSAMGFETAPNITIVVVVAAAAAARQLEVMNNCKAPRQRSLVMVSGTVVLKHFPKHQYLRLVIATAEFSNQ